jgi:cyclic peptide transporter
MYLIRIFGKKTSVFLLYSLLGIINSCLFSLLLLFINNRIGDHPRYIIGSKQDWMLFMGLLLVSYCCRRYFQGYLIRMSNVLLFDLEVSILERIKNTSFEVFRNFDQARIYTAMQDIKVISQLPRLFIDMLNNSIIVLISLIYLFFISLPAALCIVAGAVVLILLYYLQNKKVRGFLMTAREMENAFYRYLNDLIYGFKEVKMDRFRNANIFGRYLKTNREDARSLEVKAARVYMTNELTGSYGWMLLMGVLVFLLPSFTDITPGVTARFIVVILYLMAPVSMILGALPFVSKVFIALRRIDSFSQDIDNHASHPVSEDIPVKYAHTEDQPLLSFEKVTYQYGTDGFSTGPLNIDIFKGETIFITGENGSGKSTFLLLLSGLLSPHRGALSFRGSPVTDSCIDHYRNHISVVFVDGWLFSENYNDFSFDDDNELVLEWLEMMKLSPSLVLKKSDTPRGLSKGQQKRLALVFALLENKDVLILDEWAAEQDPQFRSYFYTVVLDRLRALGKTIIAVTHDDKYFNCADRVISFEKGVMVPQHSLIQD